MFELISKIIKAKKENRLNLTLRLKLFKFIKSLKYIFFDPANEYIRLHSPEYVTPSIEKEELDLVKRIFESYRKMKEDKVDNDNLFKPSSLWQSQLNISYSYLIDGLKNNDLNQFHFFLSNFGNWKQYHGVESNLLIRNNMNNFLNRRYLKNEIFLKPLKYWNWINNNKKSISNLAYPTFGNQSGAFIEKNFIGPGSFDNDFYGSILSELVSDLEHPVVADLGAGYGKLAYFTLKNIEKSTFIDFDLPETLCLAAYYLMKCWPNKKTLLYGEDTFSENSKQKYDLIFMPSNQIQYIGKNSVDLFINKNSLGEMSPNAASNYVNYISSATKYFFHLNHEINKNNFSDNSASLLANEYPVPKDKFKLILRSPDIWSSFPSGKKDHFIEDIFIYLYEKKINNKNR